jgi:hypothetical protein
MTEADFGNALRILGERERGTGRLEEAVAAFRDALKERTRERVPLDWAMSFGNQGVALMFLAERAKNRMTAETALLQIELAFETSRSAGHAPLAAYFAARVAEARRIRDALKGT